MAPLPFATALLPTAVELISPFPCAALPIPTAPSVLAIELGPTATLFKPVPCIKVAVSPTYVPKDAVDVKPPEILASTVNPNAPKDAVWA